MFSPNYMSHLSIIILSIKIDFEFRFKIDTIINRNQQKQYLFFHINLNGGYNISLHIFNPIKYIDFCSLINKYRYCGKFTKQNMIKTISFVKKIAFFISKCNSFCKCYLTVLPQ